MGGASSHECFTCSLESLPAEDTACTSPAMSPPRQKPPLAKKAVGKKVVGGEGHTATGLPPTCRRPPRLPDNALGLSNQEVADVRRVHGLLAKDASKHCVRMHIKFFRRHPEHLERFCGRQAKAEPLHYAPAELRRNSEFTARSLMHGLAQLQTLRCSVSGDTAMMSSQLAGLARAHRGLGLTRGALRRYADVMLAYLEEALPQDMTPPTKQSWVTFLATLTEALADAIEQQERTAPAPGYGGKVSSSYTSSWIEHELPKGWPLEVYYAGARTAQGRRKLGGAGSVCNGCNQPVCSCKWDTIHEGKMWRNDSDTFPSLIEDDEVKSQGDTHGQRSRSASETFPIGTSASHFNSRG